MRSRSFCSVLVFMLAISSAALAGNRYWISWEHHGPDDCYLMQIDELGNTTIPPAYVMSYHSHSTAIASLNASRIVYYANDDETVRSLVDKNTLSPSTPRQILDLNDSDGLQVTQGASAFFLAGETRGQILRGFPLSSKGKPTGSTFRLSPRTDGGHSQGGVTADGRMAFSVNNDSPLDKAYLQPLRTNGIPIGAPVVAASAGSFDGIDVTGVLSGNIRFVVYMDASKARLILQRVDASTGQKVGGSIDLGPADPDHSPQQVAVDPLGRFVLFSDDVQPCDVSGLFYQALDVTGNASGSRKEIIGCSWIESTGNVHGQRGFDILMD